MELPFKASKRFNQSNLSKPVYDLMDILFDIQDLQKTTIGCDLNVKEMPLGKISADQIRQALAKLKSIYGLIQQNAPVRDLIAASNEFYTLLPHACGVNCPPIIRSIKTVIAKSQFLENLSNYTMMHNFLDGENPEFLHPYDLCYHKLHASIEPIEKHSANFQQLCDIIKSQSPIKVLQIFKVQREAEIDRNGDCHINFKFRNHQLLWHGSRLSNFTNILCHGLRISPAEGMHCCSMYAFISWPVYVFQMLTNNISHVLFTTISACQWRFVWKRCLLFGLFCEGSQLLSD